MIQKIIYIIGPTASGKTFIANTLGKYFNLPVLSMDSMQIYKELDIGTSKPSNEDLQNIRYFGINIVNPDFHYSIGDYLLYAKNIIQSLNDKAILIVGGTGLYYDGLTIGFSAIPPKNEEIRKNLINYYNTDGIKSLYNKLLNVDPDYAKKIKKNDLKRIIRALEVYEITGKCFSYFHREKDIKPLEFENLKFGILMPRYRLYDKINKRVDLMFENGLVNEAKILYEKYKDNDLPSLKALGYSDLFDFFSNKLSLEDAKENIKKKTRNYAKRQITWFKKDKEVKWIYLVNEEELNIAKTINYGSFDLNKIKRKTNRHIYQNFESEFYEFVLNFKNFEIILENDVIDFLVKRLKTFI